MSFVEVSCTVRLRTRGSSECPVEKEGWKVEGRTRERKKERKKERKRRKERREEGKEEKERNRSVRRWSTTTRGAL
jgi:hypothetical protein